jgi:hypothetical protein
MLSLKSMIPFLEQEAEEIDIAYIEIARWPS